MSSTRQRARSPSPRCSRRIARRRPSIDSEIPRRCSTSGCARPRIISASSKRTLPGSSQRLSSNALPNALAVRSSTSFAARDIWSTRLVVRGSLAVPPVRATTISSTSCFCSVTVEATEPCLEWGRNGQMQEHASRSDRRPPIGNGIRGPVGDPRVADATSSLPALPCEFLSRPSRSQPLESPPLSIRAGVADAPFLLPGTRPTTMKSTALHDTHLAAGARMVEFGGWHMPVQYGPILDEVKLVRERTGLFDLCHMGRVRVGGADAVRFVDHVVTCWCGGMKPGAIRYGLICREDGNPIDDVLVYRGTDEVFVVVNASNTDVDLAWLRDHAAGFSVRIEDQTDE